MNSLKQLEYYSKRARFHTYSIWLFTQSDIKTIIVPKTAFGALCALATPVFGIEPSAGPTAITVLRRLPLTAFWVWVNLLPFAIDNQRQPLSIIEDAVNKPWRSLPSGRLTASQAKAVMLCLYALAILTSWNFGGLEQSLALIVLGIFLFMQPIVPR